MISFLKDKNININLLYNYFVFNTVIPSLYSYGVGDVEFIAGDVFNVPLVGWLFLKNKYVKK